MKKRKFILEGYKVTYFFDYNSLFKDILLQYKESYDEALKEIFLYKIDIYLKLKYMGYQILYVPSSEKKLIERGFNHLEGIFKKLGLKEVKGLHKKEELTQVGKTLVEREKMIDNYYYDGPPIKKLLIVDDVCTTGSSLKGVIKALRDSCTTICIVILAKV
ncbi:MAG: hypothetical protein Q4B60_01130 [Erysipelotrichaceae bacterium]|nr:hypothetical protein [Erysipelotrichaceae bacterium]